MAEQTDPQDAPFSLRLTPAQRLEIEQAAERIGLTLGAYVRFSALDRAVEENRRAREKKA